MRSKKIIISILASLGFLLLTLLLLVFVFPNVSLKHLIEKSAEKQLKYAQRIEIGSIRISPLGNIRAINLLITSRLNEEPDPNLAVEGGVFDGFYCAPQVGFDPFAIGEILIKPSIRSLIAKKPNATFALSLSRDDNDTLGNIEGALDSKSEFRKVTLNAKDISLNEFTLLSNFIKVQLHGLLNLDTNLILDTGNQIVDLSLNMNAANTVMCPKRLKLNMGGVPFIELPFTRFGNIEASLSSAQDQAINIDKFTTDGPDLMINAHGQIWLKTPQNPEMRVDLTIIVQPGQEWLEQHSMQVIYSVCRKQDDGSIELRLSGSGKNIRKDCGKPIIEELPPASDTPTKEATDEPVQQAPQDANGEQDQKTRDTVRTGVQRPMPTNRVPLRRGAQVEEANALGVLTPKERNMIEAAPELRRAVIEGNKEAEKALESRGLRRERPIGARPGRKALSEP